MIGLARQEERAFHLRKDLFAINHPVGRYTKTDKEKESDSSPYDLENSERSAKAHVGKYKNIKRLKKENLKILLYKQVNVGFVAAVHI